MKKRFPVLMGLVVLFCGLIASAAVYVADELWGTTSGGLKVVVEQAGRIVYSAQLQNEFGQSVHADMKLYFEGSAGEFIIEVKEGKVRMLLAHCPDKICMGEDWTDQPFRPIICLPQKVIISVERTEEEQSDSEYSEPDALSK